MEWATIPSSILDNLPGIVKGEILKMPPDKQAVFVEEFRRKSKSVGMAYLLWFVIGLHYIYLGKGGLQFFFWVTGAGLLVWWFIDLFRIPGLVRSYNKDMATDVLRDIKIISS